MRREQGSVALALSLGLVHGNLQGAVALPPSSPNCQQLEVLEPHTDARPIVGPDRALWVLATDGAIWRGQLEPGSGRLVWSVHPPPPGVRLEQFGVTQGPQVFGVAPGRSPHGPYSVYRVDFSRTHPRWDELRPPCIASLRRPSPDADGVVWIGGEWGEVFRIEAGAWVKELLPLPYHVEGLWMLGSGQGWARGETRGLTAVFRRSSAGKWTTVAAGREELGALIFATQEAAFVHGTQGLLRVEAADGTTVPVDPGFPPQTWGVAELDGPASGWSWTAAGLFRYADQRWSRLLGPGGPVVLRLVGLGEKGLFVVLEGNQLARLATCDGSEPAAGGPFRLERLRPITDQGQCCAGMAVLTLGGEEQLYLVNQESVNPTIRFQVEGDLVTTTPRDWRTLTERLGNGGPGQGAAPVYDQTPLAADLDGDADEDLVLLSMYDVDRLYLNVRDSHFVDWTEEAGIGGSIWDDSVGGCLLDADLDGDLDLYVTNALASDRLYVNNGAASFADATAQAALETEPGSRRATCVDLDHDGDTDIAVATWGRGLLLRENVSGAGRSAFRTRRLFVPDGSTVSELNLNSVAAADLDADGLPELFCAVRSGCDRFLRNRGGLAFTDDPGFLPRDQPCEQTAGGTFADLDHDGDLDLMLTGPDGSRIYQSLGAALATLAIEPAVSAFTRNGAYVAFDLEADGDLDVFHGTQDRTSSAVLWRNRQDDNSWLMLRVEGPPSNTSGVGAEVELYPAAQGGSGALAPRLAWRQVTGGAGHGMDTKWLHFGGVDPHATYDLRVRLAGAKERWLRGVKPPSRQVVKLEASIGGPARAVEAARRFLGGYWNRRFAAVTLLAWGAGLVLSRVLRRAGPLGPLPALLFLGQPLWALVLLIVLPLDPGLPRVATATGTTALLPLLALALLRPRASVPTTPELVAELSFTLRAFRHNQAPRRALDGLAFTLKNVAGGAVPLDPTLAALLQDELRAFAEIALPDLLAIRRQAEAAGVAVAVDPPDLERLGRAVGQALLSEGRQPPQDRLLDLAQQLGSVTGWVRALQADAERRLALDLGPELLRFVRARSASSPCRIECDVPPGNGLRVGILAEDMVRVLDILVDNATQATAGRADAVIRLDARATDHRVSISVTDNGPGVSEALRDSLFRAGAGRAGPGRGFGLPYARHRLERYGATVGLDSAHTPGARFVIELERWSSPDLSETT